MRPVALGAPASAERQRVSGSETVGRFEWRSRKRARDKSMQTLHTQSAVGAAAFIPPTRLRVSRNFLWHLLRAPERKRLDAAIGVFGAQLQSVALAASAGETWAQATLALYQRAEHEA